MIIFKKIYHYIGFWREGFILAFRFIFSFIADLLFMRKRETLKVLSRKGISGNLFPVLSEDANKEFCLSCTHCSQSCPTGAIEWSKKGESSIQLDLCILCGLCQEVCPKNWLSLSKELNLSIVSRKELERPL